MLSQGKIISHPVPPYTMAWTNSSVVVAGCDKRVVMYSKVGKILQQFDYSRDATEREFSAIVASPSGQALVIGSYNRWVVKVVLVVWRCGACWG